MISEFFSTTKKLFERFEFLEKLTILSTLFCMSTYILIHSSMLMTGLIGITSKTEIDTLHRNLVFIALPVIITSQYLNAKHNLKVALTFIPGVSILTLQLVAPQFFKQILGICNCCYGHYITSLGGVLILISTYISMRECNKC
jgi:hypothetical protein